VLTGAAPVWLYLRVAHALHGKARKLIYRSPVTGDVAIFDHSRFLLFCLSRTRRTDTNHGHLICCAEYFLQESQIKLFRQPPLPAGDVFYATGRLVLTRQAAVKYEMHEF